MISESAITFRQNGSINLTRPSKGGDKQADPQKTDDKEIEDSIDLNVGASLAEGLKNAKTDEELFKLLDEGQQQIKESVDKFRALADVRLNGGSNGTNRSNPQDVIFDSVRDVVVSLMEEQGKPDTEKNPNSFETRLALAIRDRDPELMDDLQKKLLG